MELPSVNIIGISGKKSRDVANRFYGKERGIEV